MTADHLLTRLRQRVEIARAVESNVSLHPDQVLALAECVELLDTVIEAQATTESQVAWMKRRKAALAKLEAL